jgi:hypothetical protein
MVSIHLPRVKFDRTQNSEKLAPSPLQTLAAGRECALTAVRAPM